eukprot:TRINITY_DN1988_c0_g1_i1.p1 TRINITY_DN1988_c0_g1~~TRINITY_DN1988_c0_g1_i1.p1  ORF type:complete len:245 (+),score=45.12 TRINITY_DN1988_c0_g1_i1:206-940(+)
MGCGESKSEKPGEPQVAPLTPANSNASPKQSASSSRRTVLANSTNSVHSPRSDPTDKQAVQAARSFKIEEAGLSIRMTEDKFPPGGDAIARVVYAHKIAGQWRIALAMSSNSPRGSCEQNIPVEGAIVPPGTPARRSAVLAESISEVLYQEQDKDGEEEDRVLYVKQLKVAEEAQRLEAQICSKGVQSNSTLQPAQIVVFEETATEEMSSNQRMSVDSDYLPIDRLMGSASDNLWFTGKRTEPF